MAKYGIDKLIDHAGDEKSTEMDKLHQYTKWVDEFYSAYNDAIQRARNYLYFLYIDQWDPEQRSAREAMGKPCLQVNKVGVIIRSILGEQRVNSPQLAARPLNNEDDVPQAQIDLRSDMLRQISYDSKSDVVYQTASKNMLECGWGAVRVGTEYESDDSLNQVLRFYPVAGFDRAFFDPTAIESDKSDGDYCGFYETISRDKWDELYPNEELPEEPTNIYIFNWSSRETVTICHLYYKDYYTKKLVLLSNGKVMEKKAAKSLLKEQAAILEANPDLAMLPDIEALEIVKEVERQCYNIKYVKFVQNKILEEMDWKGKLLPIVFFEGNSFYMDGEVVPISFVQDAIDVQKIINYETSEFVYELLLGRKEHYMATASNIQGYEDAWRNPHQVQGVLQFNPDEKTGQPPIFIPPREINPAYLQLDQKAKADLQEVTGRYDELRGNETNAISGTAIARRQQASSAPNNIYDDNWERGIQQVGRVAMDLIPHVYDTERVIQARNVEGKGSAVKINEFMGYQMDENGDMQEQYNNDVRTGRFDIEVKVEGSFDMQLEGAFKRFGELLAVSPTAAPLIMDLMAEVSGLPNAQKLKERLQTQVPPNILAKENGEPPPPPPPPPPPDPQIEIERGKLQLEAQGLQLENKKITLDAVDKAKRTAIEAHSKGVDSATKIAEARAKVLSHTLDYKSDIFKGLAGIKMTQIKANAGSNSNSEQQNIDNAESRRLAEDGQSQSLKDMGI